jgi:hypothetical protein
MKRMAKRYHQKSPVDRSPKVIEINDQEFAFEEPNKKITPREKKSDGSSQQVFNFFKREGS